MRLNKTKVLNLLGLARRAKKIIIGEDMVLSFLQDKKLYIVFVASDASKKQIDKFNKKCFYYNVEINNDFTCNELSHAIGSPMCKYIGVIDQGFFNALKRELNGGAVNEG